MSSVTEILNSQYHDTFLKNNNYVIMFYGSEHCGHCIKMKPIVENLARNNRNLVFGHVETSKTKVQGLEGVPTFIGYVNGQLYEIIVGADQAKLNQLISKMNNLRAQQR